VLPTDCIFARRLWEPEDIMPLFSIRSAVGLELTEKYLYVAVSEGVVRFPRFDREIDFASWESIPIDAEVVDVRAVGDNIHILTPDGAIVRREIDFFAQFEPPESELSRYSPDIGGCPPFGERYSMPPGFYLGSADTIWDLHLNAFNITDCASDKQGDIYFTTDGLGLFRVERRIGIAERMGFGPCCNNIRAMHKGGDTLFFGGCDNLSICAFSCFDNSSGFYSWVEGDYGVSFPNYGPVYDMVVYGRDIFLATAGGLALYDMQGKSWLRPTGMGSVPIDVPHALTIFRDTLYIAASDGIYSMDLNNRILVRRSSVGEGRFVDIDTAFGTVFAVGDFGAVKKEDSLFVRFNPPDGTLTNLVRCITCGPSGEAIFGSRTGILIVEKSGRRTVLPNSIWLDGRTPEDIVATRLHLWIATENGLYLYHRRRKTTRYMSEATDLPKTAIYRLLLDGDWLWLMTDIGLYRFFWNEPDRPEY